MIQTIRPEAFAASFQTKRTQNICMLSYTRTYSILLSTSRRLVPLSLQRGKRMACFSSYSFRILIFYTEEVAPHVIVIPILQHTAFYFPPPASQDRAVHSMEIKDFIILWTYSQWRQAIVVIPPLSPERETLACFPSYSFCILVFYAEEKVPHVTVIPILWHTAFYFPPPAKGWRSPFLSRTGNGLHAFLCSNIQHSTFHHSLKRMVPLSLQNGKRFACFR